MLGRDSCHAACWRFAMPVKDQKSGFVGVRAALVVPADTECEKVLTASAGCS